jgi:GNAT superfamily N-acetyltransferase
VERPDERRIRRARHADATRLTAIAHAAKAHWGYASSELATWRDDLTVTPARLDEDAYCCLDDDLGDTIAFFAVSRATSDDGAVICELEHMWVEPDAMGRGHGAALLRHALRVARDAGARELRIASDPHAEGFYLRMGAVCVGDVPSRPAGRRLPLLVYRLDDAATPS